MQAVTTTPEERTALLREADWAREVPEDHLAHLAAAGRVCRYDKGQRLVEQGSENRWMGVILEGEIEVVGRQIAGEDRLLRVMGPGRSIGEFSLLDKQKRSASVDALEPTTVIQWQPDDINQLLDAHPKVAFALVLRLARDLSRRIRTIEGRAAF